MGARIVSVMSDFSDGDTEGPIRAAGATDLVTDAAGAIMSPVLNYVDTDLQNIPSTDVANNGTITEQSGYLQMSNNAGVDTGWHVGGAFNGPVRYFDAPNGDFVAMVHVTKVGPIGAGPGHSAGGIVLFDPADPTNAFYMALQGTDLPAWDGYHQRDREPAADNVYGDNNDNRDKWVALVRRGVNLYSYNANGLGVATDDPWTLTWTQRDLQVTEWDWAGKSIGVMARNGGPATTLAIDYQFRSFELTQVKTLV